MKNLTQEAGAQPDAWDAAGSQPGVVME
jgi:hypothetical protein